MMSLVLIMIGADQQNIKIKQDKMVASYIHESQTQK